MFTVALRTHRSKGNAHRLAIKLAFGNFLRRTRRRKPHYSNALVCSSSAAGFTYAVRLRWGVLVWAVESKLRRLSLDRLGSVRTHSWSKSRSPRTIRTISTPSLAARKKITKLPCEMLRHSPSLCVRRGEPSLGLLAISLQVDLICSIQRYAASGLSRAIYSDNSNKSCAADGE